MLKPRTYHDILDAIRENRSAFSALVDEVRANKRLSDEGRRDVLTEAYKDAMTRHNALLAELKEAREAALTLARGRAFAQKDAGEMNYRLALETAREAMKDGSKLNAIFQQAVETRDATLLRALALVGYQNDNHALVESVAEYDRDVALLVDVESEIGDMATPTQRLANSMASTAPARPAEVSNTVDNPLR